MATRNRIRQISEEIERLRKLLEEKGDAVDDPGLDSVLSGLEAEKANLVRLLGP